MSSKSISALALAPNLFSQARQLELMSIVQRCGARGGEALVGAPSAVGRSKLCSLSDCASPVFHLGETASGSWKICEERGTKVGWFRTRQAAIKYARDESPNGNFVIIDDLGDVE